MKKYRRLERDLALEEHNVFAANRGVLTGKLAQFANGGLYHTDEDVHPPKRTTISIHTAKLDALESIIEETGGENLLVAYSYKFDLDRLRKKFPSARVADEGDEVIRDWNRGQVRMLLTHPASLGHGMNLQFGGKHTVWYGLTPSLELYQQFNARLRRPGQDGGAVFIHHIITKSTFDEKLNELLRGKATTIKATRLYLQLQRDEVTKK